MTTMTTMARSEPATTLWALDPAHTEVGFEVKHMMFAKVRGRFTDVEGSLYLAPEGAETDSRVSVVIQWSVQQSGPQATSVPIDCAI